MNRPPKLGRGAPSARGTGDDCTAVGQDDFIVKAPSISLLRGGGAIHGIGEKFAANPVTGTGSMTLPICTSPGRPGKDLAATGAVRLSCSRPKFAEARQRQKAFFLIT